PRPGSRRSPRRDPPRGSRGPRSEDFPVTLQADRLDLVVSTQRGKSGHELAALAEARIERAAACSGPRRSVRVARGNNPGRAAMQVLADIQKTLALILAFGSPVVRNRPRL